MTIRCKCEHCGVSLKVKDDLAGKQKRCPQCQNMFSIPPLENESARPSQQPAKTRKEVDSEEEFPYFDDIPVRRPIVPNEDAPEFSSPLSGGGVDEINPYDPPQRRPENKVTGSAAGIAGELLRKIESSDRKSKGSGAANKKKRKIFGDVEGDLTTSETSAKESFIMMMQGFVLPLIGLSALVFGAWYASDYMMGTRLKLPPLGKVSGTITINGQPVRNARIEFHPVAAAKVTGGENLATSMAISDGNGKFVLYYGAGIPGAVIGQHIIMISAQDEFGHELVPANWNSASQQSFDVKAGSNKVTLDIETRGLGDPGSPPDPNAPPATPPEAPPPAPPQ